MKPEPVPYDGLFNSVVRRLRAAKTIFGQNVKLVLRQMSDEQWALLTLPYLLVVPTVTRVEGGGAAGRAQGWVTNPRSITFLAQLDGRGSEADWRAAIDIEIAERQLIGALVDWKPRPWFDDTTYAGMRIEATRAPAVKVSFVFQFHEQIAVAEEPDEELCAAFEAGPVQLGNIKVDFSNPCCPVEKVEADPCEEPDPCAPCAPDKQWSMAMWLSEKGEQDD